MKNKQMSSIELANMLKIEHRAIKNIIRKHFKEEATEEYRIEPEKGPGGRPIVSVLLKPQHVLFVLLFLKSKNNILKSKIIESLADGLESLTAIIETIKKIDFDTDLQELFVYFAQESESKRFKIGISRNPERRIKELNTGNPEQLKLMYCYLASEGFKDEKSVHSALASDRIRGEWFNDSLPVRASMVGKSVVTALETKQLAIE